MSVDTLHKGETKDDDDEDDDDDDDNLFNPINHTLIQDMSSMSYVQNETFSYNKQLL
jgi:hypothetical protein